MTWHLVGHRDTTLPLPFYGCYGLSEHRFDQSKKCYIGPLGRTRRRWEDNIKMDLREIGCDVTGFFWLRIRTGGGLL
jgi:hypothetical protein